MARPWWSDIGNLVAPRVNAETLAALLGSAINAGGHRKRIEFATEIVMAGSVARILRDRLGGRRAIDVKPGRPDLDPSSVVRRRSREGTMNQPKKVETAEQTEIVTTLNELLEAERAGVAT